jgi:hypothetical protein
VSDSPFNSGGEGCPFPLAVFCLDLLTAIVSIAAPALQSISLAMLAQPTEGVHHAGVFSLTIYESQQFIEFIAAQAALPLARE